MERATDVFQSLVLHGLPRLVDHEPIMSPVCKVPAYPTIPYQGDLSFIGACRLTLLRRPVWRCNMKHDTPACCELSIEKPSNEDFIFRHHLIRFSLDIPFIL